MRNLYNTSATLRRYAMDINQLLDEMERAVDVPSSDFGQILDLVGQVRLVAHEGVQLGGVVFNPNQQDRLLAALTALGASNEELRQEAKDLNHWLQALPFWLLLIGFFRKIFFKIKIVNFVHS